VAGAEAFLVTGSDPTLVADAVATLTGRLVGDGDRNFMVQELSGGDYQIGALVDAAQTAPFLTERRVVVARNAGRFTKAEEYGPLVEYLNDPLPSTGLVLVWEKGPDQAQLPRVPKKLADALKAMGGETVATEVPTQGRARAEWLKEQLAASPIKLDARAREVVAQHLGEDAGRLGSLIAKLVTAYGEGASVSAAEVEPFLGDAGSVPRWELTDAIEKGDVAVALDKLHRMMGGGGLHPLQIMATLQGWVGRLVRLDGSDATSESQAAELLGMKGSTFPARKALTTSRRFRHDGTVRALQLIAAADLDLRGAQAWPDDLVMEVLVSRLARLSRSTR